MATACIKSTWFALLLATVFMAGSGAAQPAYLYKPFLFDCPADFEPADEAELAKGLAEVARAQSGMQATDTLWAAYWNNAYPSYRWHQALMAAGRLHKGHKNGGRVAILHLAVYDALTVVEKLKAVYQVPPPCVQSPAIGCLGLVGEGSSFICAYSAAASAAHAIINYYFPEQQEATDSLLAAFRKARLQSGLQLPSDIERGLYIGREVARQYVAYAKNDRTDKKWAGQVPRSDGLWLGEPGPWDPMKAQWRPLTLERPDQFRPAPPPTDWSADMEELRQFNQAHAYSDIAWKWKSQPIWDDLIERKIMAYGLRAIEAAFANAVFHTARFDAIIAAWDGKYHYWGIRPFQYDPTFKPILVQTPNFPGYPAGHTTVAGSLAAVLSYLFPLDQAEFYALAEECSESRFEGGVHFRTDNEVGLRVGAQVGTQVIQAFERKKRTP
ncbi:vanadium-dependent haloperoxidase [Phaeodactylibacter luteus]|nr:vanadium-dependent haloperoxidase [Phaeodactylibacter luteus]